MEIDEIADKITEFEEEEHATDASRRRIGLLISVLALVLAITAVGSNKNSKELVVSAISASDTWAYYQAKNNRQVAYTIAADQLEAALAQPGLSDEARQPIAGNVQRYRDTARRYDSEQDGTGKKELAEKARAFEHERNTAEHRENYFNLAEALLQIAIVLSSAAITANARFLVIASGALGVAGALLSINAFFLLVDLHL